VLAERVGRAQDDMLVVTLSGAVVGVAMAVMFTMIGDPNADLAVVLDEAMGHLEAGLRI
jgi:hypothetical protein